MSVASDELVSIGYSYDKKSGESAEGRVSVPISMQFDPVFLKHRVVIQIAEEFKQQGKSIWLDGRPVVPGVSNVDRNSYETIGVVIDSSGSFDLDCYNFSGT